MKPYVQQEIKSCGFFSKLINGKPTENTWAEINNILAEAENVHALTAEKVQSAVKKWGGKLDESSFEARSGLYRKFADIAYSEAQSCEDSLLSDCEYLAEVLQMPPHLKKLADKGAKQSAYFTRCDKLLKQQEVLDINGINKIFGYDYEDGFKIRKQVFQEHFNTIFDAISERQRFTPDEEAALRQDCATLDIPYEFKNNIVNALKRYRDLWNAEHNKLGNIQVDIPLQQGEICHAAAQAGLCQHKVVEKEDNYFELTRKFNIDETVTFKGEKLEHPKTKEEITALLDIGYFFLTNQRIIYLSKKTAQTVELDQITSADLDVNIITFHTKENGDFLYKFSDEAAGVMYILFNRTYQENVK